LREAPWTAVAAATAFPPARFSALELCLHLLPRHSSFALLARH